MSSLWTPDGEQAVGAAPSQAEQELAEQLAAMQ
jgi:hypothetical protein